MEVERSYDVEDIVRQALDPYFTIYCRPLPKDFELPSLLVTLVGGDDLNKIDSFDIVLDARANTDAEAMTLLLDATATLKQVTAEQTTPLRYMEVNSVGSWGSDPVRPELAMCSSRIRLYTHKFNKTIELK